MNNQDPSRRMGNLPPTFGLNRRILAKIDEVRTASGGNYPYQVDYLFYTGEGSIFGSDNVVLRETFGVWILPINSQVLFTDIELWNDGQHLSVKNKDNRNRYFIVTSDEMPPTLRLANVVEDETNAFQHTLSDAEAEVLAQLIESSSPVIPKEVKASYGGYNPF